MLLAFLIRAVMQRRPTRCVKAGDEPRLIPRTENSMWPIARMILDPLDDDGCDISPDATPSNGRHTSLSR